MNSIATTLEQTTPSIIAAPWQLQGRALILLLDHKNNTYPFKQFTGNGGRYGFLMLVDYKTSDVGPYYELLYVPGKTEINRSKRFCISDIVVSSLDSVTSGRANWGIPKDLAHFDWQETSGEHRVLVNQNGQRLCDLSFKTNQGLGKIKMPLNTAWLPASLRSFGQSLDGKNVFTFSPKALGKISSASLNSLRGYENFGHISEDNVKAAFFVPDFSMVFPEAQRSSL